MYGIARAHIAKVRAGRALVAMLTLHAAFAANAKDDIEFAQEHLPEVAMDNRYGSLPFWSGSDEEATRTSWIFQSAYSSTSTGELDISGPLFSVGASKRLSDHWDAGVFLFYDALQLSGGTEQRDLQTLFAPDTPITRPVPAEFSGLDGTATDVGFGVHAAWRRDGGFLGDHRWRGGLLWQRVSLEDYRFDYRILSGPQTGLTGTIDFDAEYAHLVPFVGLDLPRNYGQWSTNAHMLVVYPLPRRGVVGHITGPGFDIHGDTEDVGNGKHFGDPYVSFGYSIAYEPAHLSFDIGAMLAQGLLDPHVHRGIERNLLLSFSIGW